MGFTLDQQEYADHCGVHTSQITRWRQQGKLEGSYKKIGGKWHYDKVLADKCVMNNVNQTQRKAQAKAKNKGLNIPTKEEIKAQVEAAGTGKLSLGEAQRIQAQFKAALLKLEYEEKSGKLIAREQVDADFFALSRQTRDAILNIPDRISPEIAGITDSTIINERLRFELTQALEDLSK